MNTFKRIVGGLILFVASITGVYGNTQLPLGEFTSVPVSFLACDQKIQVMEVLKAHLDSGYKEAAKVWRRLAVQQGPYGPACARVSGYIGVEEVLWSGKLDFPDEKGRDVVIASILVRLQNGAIVRQFGYLQGVDIVDPALLGAKPA